MSLGLSYGPIVSSLDNQAALRKRNLAQQNNPRGNRPTMAIRDAEGNYRNRCGTRLVRIWDSIHLSAILCGVQN